MAALVSAAFCGIVFGLGLLISGMAQPAKVQNFLDLFGRWDPSLAVVMAAALAVSWAGFALARRRAQPTFAPQWSWPDRTEIDAPLVAGSALFGIGWGLIGLCPGPALVDILTGSPQARDRVRHRDGCRHDPARRLALACNDAAEDRDF